MNQSMTNLPVNATAADLRDIGCTCRREINYGVPCYVVRDPSGLIVDPLATCRTARGAWASAARMVSARIRAEQEVRS